MAYKMPELKIEPMAHNHMLDAMRFQTLYLGDPMPPATAMRTAPPLTREMFQETIRELEDNASRISFPRIVVPAIRRRRHDCRDVKGKFCRDPRGPSRKWQINERLTHQMDLREVFQCHIMQDLAVHGESFVKVVK